MPGPGPEPLVFFPAPELAELPELPEFPLTDDPREVALQSTLGPLEAFAVVVAVVHDPGAGGTGTPELDPA